ncbi:hypothetical protein DPMN_035269 [Dreissena polymorpha]|uniref:non-specific serine/threonine protein kinase n=1 Tax=Dreissena polymorpha TaxID=45954 RepID=A0A9D4RKF6_DREPO|nr:hypothetical protein DPMN_035269 [Dreissena polymorpha]
MIFLLFGHLVVFVFGCVCHLFKRGGFTSFEDEESGRNDLSMYTGHDSSHDMTNVTFEPLPDILAKTLSTRALRPRIVCSDTQKQSEASKLVTVFKPFPRNQLLYIKEIGLGWFGQVLQGSADSISQDSRQTQVVVKVLKDDATASEKSLFLEEVAPYRDLEHVNIIQLLGQCTETIPLLAILEYPPLGDLKSYLMSNKRGPFIQFAMDAARGLACMHKHSYIHHDFAARNCMLMADLQLKIGDYGIGEDLFREDYYDTGRDLLPIRWMSPESLEVKQGVWQVNNFTVQSNVWSLSVLLWEILTLGRKPYNSLRDEDVLQKVVREGSIKLLPPDTHVPLHDRWFEVMEMCWQEADDRPSADDILAFLQQIEEEVTSQSHDLVQTAPSIETHIKTGVQSPEFESKFVMSKTVNQSNKHIAEVLVHRVDRSEGFESDFSKDITIRKNIHSQGFEDNFLPGASLSDSELLHNDSIIASGGNDVEGTQSFGKNMGKNVFDSDHNLNLLLPPVPVQMSTPSKPRTEDHHLQNTAKTEGSSSNYVTAISGAGSTSKTQNKDTSSNAAYSVNTALVSSQKAKNLFGEKSETQSSDDGYKTGISSSAPDLVLSPDIKTKFSNTENEVSEDSGSESPRLDSKSSPKHADLETEKAKELYMSKGASLSSVSLKSRSLGTIPEDGIPSDNTSQSGLVFEENEENENEDVGMNFEWDDYDGEQLVGRVRYMSEDSIPSTKSPRHVDVEEWPFDQDSGSESNSRPGSLASESDAEVTRLSINSNSSIDTRARIASILTNRLNSLIKNTNPTPSTAQSMFYSLSDDEEDADVASPGEIVSQDLIQDNMDASFNHDSGATLATVQEEEEENEDWNYIQKESSYQEQNDDLIRQDLDSIAEQVLGSKHLQNVSGVKVKVLNSRHDPLTASEDIDSIA